MLGMPVLTMPMLGMTMLGTTWHGHADEGLRPDSSLGHAEWHAA